jgi:hypothetical protein
MSRFRLLSITDALDALFMPPCKGAPILVWMCFILLLIANRTTPIWQGDLSDPDDYLYLVQAFDWLKGQGWFDLVQHRMNPPQGTFIHFSHLLSAFYAGFIFLLQPFFGSLTAALITSIIIPPVYLALLLLSVRWLARMMIAPEWGDLTAYFLFFSPVIISDFVPGHIDHHGLEALLAVVAFCCMARMIERPAELIWAAAAGLALALGLTIGLEIVAIVGLFSMCLGAWAMIEGGAAVRSGVLFSLTLFVGSLGFLLVTRAPQHIFDVDIQAYSIVYVILTGSIALCFASVALVGKKASAVTRCLVGGGVAAATGLAFLHAFPALKGGPYGGLDPVLAKLIFDSASEAWPVIRDGASWTKQIGPLVCPMVALGANLWMLICAPDRTRRWLWGMLLFVLSACTGLGAFYQCRFFSYAQSFAVIPLTAMVWRDWGYKPHIPLGRDALRIVRLALILLVCPLSAIVVGNYGDDSHDKGAAQSAPVKQASPKGCDMHFLADLLNDKQGYGSHPRLIINSLNEGTELMFRTPHMVLASPFHMNVDGNLDALRFFTTHDPDEAKAIAERRGAELVVICSMPSQLQSYGSATERTFVQQLIGNQIPVWLTPIQSPQLGDLRLFEIHASGV